MPVSSAPIAEAAGATPVSWKRADGESVPGYVFGKAGNPAVIVVQEWWGIDAEVLEHAKKISEHGYRTLVPDLYRGVVGIVAEEAHHLMTNLNWATAMDDIRGAVALLLDVEGSKSVGITGFCMGGALSTAAAVHVPRLNCAAPFYGIPSADFAPPRDIKCPIQVHFGEKDDTKGFTDATTMAAYKEALRECPQEHEVIFYPTVGHAFMNATPAGKERRSALGQGEHDQAAVDLAWTNLFAFFAKHLA